MPAPVGGDTPNRYRPNSIDDRQVTDPLQSSAYLAIATALGAITDDIDPDTRLDYATRRALRTAENALRRAAWLIVVHAVHNPSASDVERVVAGLLPVEEPS